MAQIVFGVVFFFFKRSRLRHQQCVTAHLLILSINEAC